MDKSPFAVDVTPDWQGLVDCIMRKGTPPRVHHIELFLDLEVQEAICRRYHLLDGLSSDSPDFVLQASVRIQRFLGYDYVRCGLDDFEAPLERLMTQDTAHLQR
ncbi:MAG TPA: hypothetical protein GX702_01115, partial [Chloroflexi bacterium]|nr:hypothetical protein [Chloroflexota bacterium]